VTGISSGKHMTQGEEEEKAIQIKKENEEKREETFATVGEIKLKEINVLIETPQVVINFIITLIPLLDKCSDSNSDSNTIFQKIPGMFNRNGKNEENECKRLSNVVKQIYDDYKKNKDKFIKNLKSTLTKINNETQDNETDKIILEFHDKIYHFLKNRKKKLDKKDASGYAEALKNLYDIFPKDIQPPSQGGKRRTKRRTRRRNKKTTKRKANKKTRMKKRKTSKRKTNKRRRR
jgi:hypothetical protein